MSDEDHINYHKQNPQNRIVFSKITSSHKKFRDIYLANISPGLAYLAVLELVEVGVSR